MWVSRYVVWFVAYAVLGWVYESTYCTIVDRRWQNRGFLYGPLCPIYGVAVIAAIAACQLMAARGIVPEPWQVFAACALGAATLEYITSWTLEQLFHARWWDYSNMPLNLNGRICVPAMVLFGLMGLLVVYVLYEPTVEATDAVAPVVVEGLSLVLVGAVTIDTTLTASALTRFADYARQISNSVNLHMDQLVDGAVERTTEAATSFAQERERFAQQMRASRIGEMSGSVMLAARRIKHYSTSGKDAAEATIVRQLESLRKDLSRLSARHNGGDETLEGRDT